MAHRLLEWRLVAPSLHSVMWTCYFRAFRKPCAVREKDGFFPEKWSRIWEYSIAFSCCYVSHASLLVHRVFMMYCLSSRRSVATDCWLSVTVFPYGDKMLYLNRSGMSIVLNHRVGVVRLNIDCQPGIHHGLIYKLREPRWWVGEHTQQMPSQSFVVVESWWDGDNAIMRVLRWIKIKSIQLGSPGFIHFDGSMLHRGSTRQNFYLPKGESL